MKKFLITIIFLLSCIGVFSQTAIPPASTWTPARNIINANFSDTYDSIAANRLRVNILNDSILAYATAINLRLLKSDTASMLGNYTRNGELASALASYIAVTDTATMLANYALTSELGDAGIAVGDVRDEIADSLNILRQLYSETVDTASAGRIAFWSEDLKLTGYPSLYTTSSTLYTNKLRFGIAYDTTANIGGREANSVRLYNNVSRLDRPNLLLYGSYTGTGIVGIKDSIVAITLGQYYGEIKFSSEGTFNKSHVPLYTPASTSSLAGFRLPNGTAPSAPENGDLWTTTGGIFTQINGSTDTLATQEYARQYGGTGTVTLSDVQNEIADSLDARIGAGVELSSIAVMIADSTGNAPGNYVTHKALVDSINANLGGAVGITLNSGTITLTGDGGTADDITFYTNGDGSYNLPTGGGNLTIMSEVQGWINDSLDVIRPLYLEIADTTSMLANYALLSEVGGGDVTLSDVQNVIADSLNAIRSTSVAGIALADSTGYAPGNYVTHTQLDAVGSGADSSLYVTVTRLTDSLNVMRNLINDLIAVVENLGVDVTAPSIDSIEIGDFADDTLVIYFNERLNTDSIPASSVFYLTEDANEMGIASISLPNDTVMYVVLDSTAAYGSTYLLDYTRAHPYLQDSTGNAIANFSNRSVINNMPEPAATGLLEGLIAYWDMEESALPIVDEVANLTSSGVVGTTAVTLSQTGILSNSMEFHYLPTYGSGQRIIVGDDVIQPANISVSLWFYLTSTDTDAFCMIHNTNPGTQNRGYYFFTGGVGGGVAARAYNSSGSYVEVDSAPGWTVSSANTWYHAVFVADGTNLTIYVNGVQRAQEAFAYDISYGADATLIIGGRDSANGWAMNGRLDEIGMWNRALTIDEITALYNSGSGIAYSSFGN